MRCELLKATEEGGKHATLIGAERDGTGNGQRDPQLRRGVLHVRSSRSRWRRGGRRCWWWTRRLDDTPEGVEPERRAERYGESRDQPPQEPTGVLSRVRG